MIDGNTPIVGFFCSGDLVALCSAPQIAAAKKTPPKRGFLSYITVCGSVTHISLDTTHWPHFGAIDHTIAVSDHAFRGTGAAAVRLRIGDVVLDFAGDGAADADAAQPVAVGRVDGAGLGVGGVQHVIGIDIDAAVAAELI